MRRQDDEQTRSISNPSPLGQVKVVEWTLEVISGNDRGKRITTAGALIRVGSDTTNELALTDPAVGRCHLQIERTPLGLLLRDLGSRSGTWIENRRIIEAFVEPGDEITLGRSRLLVHPAAARPVDLASASPGEPAGMSLSICDLAERMNYHQAKDRVIADFERLYFAEVMRSSGFDMQVAEQKTRLSMQSLYRLLKKNGLRLKELKSSRFEK
jgi:pSer/pThr/pTyr-binding forkhead associated (FHA) protein